MASESLIPQRIGIGVVACAWWVAALIGLAIAVLGGEIIWDLIIIAICALTD